MARYIVKRLLIMIPIILGLSLLMFLLSRFMPGDAVRLALGPDATAQQIANMERQLGLDKSLPVQYVNYIVGFFRGNMGLSLRTGRNVAIDVKETFPATFELVLVSMIIASFIGIPLGVISATRYNKAPDFVIRMFSMSGIAIPSFLTAILLQLLFGYWLGAFPIIGRAITPPTHITGLFLVDSLLTGNTTAFMDTLRHLFLPAISLSITSAAQIMRLTRTNMIERMNKDYILAARAYGLPNDLVENRYMLKNSFTSILTLIGMQFGSLIGNAFLVETVFGWPGMAQYSIEGMMYKDYNAIISVTLVIGIFFAVVNMIVDILYSTVDPRIKIGN